MRRECRHLGHQALKACQPGHHEQLLLSCASKLAPRQGALAGTSCHPAGVCLHACLKRGDRGCPCRTRHQCLQRWAGLFLMQATAQASAAGPVQKEGRAMLPWPQFRPLQTLPCPACQEQSGAEACREWELVGGKHPQLWQTLLMRCQHRRRGAGLESLVW